MKLLVAIFVIFSFAAFACPDVSEADLAKVKKEHVAVKEGSSMELALPNMHCGGCVKKVKEIMSKYPDLSGVKVDLAHKKMTFSCANESCDAGPAIYDLQKSGYMLGGAR